MSKFVKGQSGNPAGRPKKGTSMADVMESVLAEEIKGMPKKEALVRKVIQLAFSGEAWAMQQVMDRIDGKPRQSVDHTTKGEAITAITRTIID